MNIYADNAATTKLDIEAFEAMKKYFLDDFFNPSQLYTLGRSTKKAIDQSREIIADCIGAKPENIFFTSGGTESDNWAIKRFCSGNNNIIITSPIEHHAILNACDSVKDISKIKYLSVDKYGFVSEKSLVSSLETIDEIYCNDKKKLVSIMMANNEIGTIQNIHRLSKIAHKYGAIFHTDAVQAIGHIPINVNEMGIDLLSASAHKFNGPKGIGFLYSKNKDLQVYHNGGLQEFGMRAGTENVPAIVGMAIALKNNILQMKKNMDYLNTLTDLFYKELNNSKLDYIINGHLINRLPGNINISFKGKTGEGIMHLLDLKGISISTGSACDSTNQQISHVIKEIRVPSEYAEGTIRISFSKYNTEEEVIKVAKTLINVISL